MLLNIVRYILDKILNGVILVGFQIVFSTKYQDSGQEAYLHVLQEAHLILRGPVIDSEIEFLGEYQDLFDESCQKLGDFYAW